MGYPYFQPPFVLISFLFFFFFLNFYFSVYAIDFFYYLFLLYCNANKVIQDTLVKIAT